MRVRPAVPCVLGIDLGTSSCKVCLVDSYGKRVSREGVEYPTHTPNSGWAEQDPRDWFPAVVQAVRAVLDRSRRPASEVIGLCLSSAAHIGVLLGADGSPVRNAILWYDQRSDRESAEIAEAQGEEVYRITYNSVSPTWTLPQLVWVREHEPETWRRVRRILLSKDYLTFQLTGQQTSDPATAVSSQLYDPKRGCWSESLCETAGITPSMLPTVLSQTTVVGRLGSSAAAALGLEAGIPLVNGTLDSAAETYCAGVIDVGARLLRLASAGGIHLVLGEPRPHPMLICYPHPVESRWYVQAGTNSCTTAIQWALSAVGAAERMSLADWDALGDGIAPGADGLVFHPYLSGERCPYWDSHLRASFVGASFVHTKAHFARAVYEGVACSLRDAMSVLDGMRVGGSAMVVVGGGVKSGVWTRIVCDVLGTTLLLSDEADSSYGAALLGLHGLGLLADPGGAHRQIQRSARELRPVEENVKIYDGVYSRYRAIQRALQPVYRKPVYRKPP